MVVKDHQGLCAAPTATQALLRRYTWGNRGENVEVLDAVAVLGSAVPEHLLPLAAGDRLLGNDRRRAARVQIRPAGLQRDLQGAIGLVLVVLPELAPEVDRRVDPLVAAVPDGVEDQVVEVPPPVPDRGIDGYLALEKLPVMGSSRYVWTVVGQPVGQLTLNW